MTNTIKDTLQDKKLKSALSAIHSSRLQNNHYYVFHTQLDIYTCSAGRVTVNPYALCKYEKMLRCLRFIRTKNVLPYAGYQEIALCPSKYVYDITKAVSEMGVDFVSKFLFNLRTNL